MNPDTIITIELIIICILRIGMYVMDWQLKIFEEQVKRNIEETKLNN